MKRKLRLNFLKYIILLLFTFFLIPTTTKIETKGIKKTNQKETEKKAPPEKIEPEIKVDHSKEIVFGQSIYHTGSFAIYGTMIKNAILSCFKKVNDEGGIDGKTLKLISMDDKGEPKKAKENIEQMLKHDINMFIGNMGTRSILKVLPLIKKGSIAMLFPWGGDEKLRDSALTYIVNGSGFITPQIEALIDYIIEVIGQTKIAIFHSDGDFSTANANSAINILKDYGIPPVSVASYNRFTMDITRSADEIIKTDPKVVACLATNRPVVKLINRFFEKGYYGTTFIGIDSTCLVPILLKEKGAKFYYTSQVPDPLDDSLPIVKEYQETIKKYYPKETFNIMSLTYYISAKIAVEALKKIRGKITKEKLLNEIELMQDFDIGGFKVNFDPQTRHAFGQDITIIKG